jgi:hypothetical protein
MDDRDSSATSASERGTAGLALGVWATDELEPYETVLAAELDGEPSRTAWREAR